MRALRFDSALTYSTQEPEPVCDPGEALIRLRMAGICQTDLELTRGYHSFQGILGHEFVGELVDDAGPWLAGQRVVGEINIACGHCDYCRRDIPSQCRQRKTLGINGYPGVFADRFRLPVRNLYPVPDRLPDKTAVFTEPLAAACQVTELACIRPADRVILIGAGKLGLLCAQVLWRTGCDLVVVARRPAAVERLRRWQIPFIQPDANGQIPLERQSADVVVDCTGTADGFASALGLVRPRGTIVLKSTYADLPQADLSRVVVDEIRVIGSRCGPFPAALRLMDTAQIDVQSMIEAAYPLDDVLTAFDHAARPGVLKVLLTTDR